MFDPLAHALRIEHSLEQAKVSLATQVLHQPDYHLSILTKLISELPADWGSVARMHVTSSAGPCDLLRALTRDIEETKPEHESRFRIYTALLRLAIVIYRSDEHLVGTPHDGRLTPAEG